MDRKVGMGAGGPSGRPGVCHGGGGACKDHVHLWVL